MNNKSNLLKNNDSEFAKKFAESEQQRLAAVRKIAVLEMELASLKKAYANLETIHHTQTIILQELQEEMENKK